jgi:tetratricopeptide (TPR) repeat protein
MTPRNSFVRKIAYVVAIAVLLMPLFWLSQPATVGMKESSGSPGGKLAKLRTEYHLSQTQFGEVDPTSVTVKLTTLGMRGVAADVLWEKAMDYQMKKDFTNFAATLNQIAKVQPNFVSVWIHQGWNMSFNVSASFDDYRERYRWIIKGIDYFKEGIKYNENSARLVWELAWTLYQKIGRSDEAREFRRLFKEDDDFHGSRPLAERDNFLLARDYFEAAAEVANREGGMAGTPAFLYEAQPALSLMYYGEAVEKDGTFGEVAKRAWMRAGEAWRRYGDKEIPTTGRETNGPILVVRLNDQEMHEKTAQELTAKIKAMQPGLYEKMVAEKRAALPVAQREALDTPAAKRSQIQIGLAGAAEMSLKIDVMELARRVKEPQRREALKLAKEVADHELLATYIRRTRDLIGFKNWRLRAEVEQGDELLEARRQTHQGDVAYSEGDLITARDSYRRAFEKWRKVLDAHKELITDDSTGEDLSNTIQRYRRFLAQLDEPFPKPFILQDIVDHNEWRRAGTPEVTKMSPGGQTPSGQTPAGPAAAKPSPPTPSPGSRSPVQHSAAPASH